MTHPLGWHSMVSMRSSVAVDVDTTTCMHAKRQCTGLTVAAKLHHRTQLVATRPSTTCTGSILYRNPRRTARLPLSSTRASSAWRHASLLDASGASALPLPAAASASRSAAAAAPAAADRLASDAAAAAAAALPTGAEPSSMAAPGASSRRGWLHSCAKAQRDERGFRTA